MWDRLYQHACRKLSASTAALLLVLAAASAPPAAAESSAAESSAAESSAAESSAAESSAAESSAVAGPVPPPLPEPASADSDGQSPTAGSVPLHRQIDVLVEATLAEAGIRAAGRTTDREFLRRIFLDLAGRVPGTGESRRFLTLLSSGSGQREQVIDHLLSHPDHARRMQYFLDELIMERRGGRVVPDADWQAWLRQVVRENRSWSWITRQILSADGVDDASRPAAKFYLDRNLAAEVVTRDIGRIFLGVDLECAQCHDHPNIDSYLQRHYYGIHAFLNRSYVFTDPGSKRKVLGEKADGEVKFTSVFTDEEGGTAPRLLDLAPVPDPEGTAGKYITKPDRKNRGVPEYSRREQLARQMTDRANLDFRRNIANRIWAMLMGRGLVEPLDLHHADNPPVHRPLLDRLAVELMNHDDSLRWLIREICLSDAYQRSSVAVSDEVTSEPQVVEASLNPENLNPEEPESGTGTADARQEPTAMAAAEFAVARIKPLSPEQLAWSVMQVLGVTDRTIAAKQAELEKKDEQTEAHEVDDPAWQEEVLRESLQKYVDQFASEFAGQGGQKTGFDASARQALFLINGQPVQGWLEPSGQSLTARLAAMDGDDDVIRELFLSVLGREPDEQERTDLVSLLQESPDRQQMVRDLTWALLTSAEFRFNH